MNRFRAHVPRWIPPDPFLRHSFLSNGSTNVGVGRPSTGRERGQREVEEGKEVLQGLLLCSMCKIIVRDFVVYVLGHV